MGKTNTATEAVQLCIPRSLGRAFLARHYFIDRKGFSKRRTCGPAAPRGMAEGEERQRAKQGSADIKSPSLPHGSLPPLSPGGCSRPGEPLTFCPLPTLLDHILCFYSGHLLAGEGKAAAVAAGPTAPPGISLPRDGASCPAGPGPARPAQAGAGQAGFYFRLNIDGEG